ncbi:MAG: ABC transporter ATP-binding protein [Candidatus Woesearchaeota archaeon]
MMKPIIEIKDAWKTYHVGEVDVHALRGLSISIYTGEFVAIQGPSGSGKSTAMNLVGCLDIPTKGHIYLEGNDISLMSESDLAQIRGRKIGFIFQKFNLIPTLSAKENIKLPMSFQGISEDKKNKRAEELLKLVELDTRMNHLPSELSGGQQQRVAIARALALDPPVILADEPTGNLDSTMGNNVMEFLKKLHKEKQKTIVMVTHDDNLARYADRIEILKDGKIQKLNNKLKNNKIKKRLK